MSIKTVSIVTISQLSRFNSLLVLAYLILLQDYKHIKEWVIVEGSASKSDAQQNRENIMTKLSNFPIHIKYIDYTPGCALSDLRNKGNAACICNIIVVMDDDDYYPPCRVSHAVDTLIKSDCQIAGTSNVYMYDFELDKLFQFKGFGPNHATNNTMAYTQQYLGWNWHEPGLRNAEEKSFTRGFLNFMAQLDADKCVIVSAHGANTVCKKMFSNGCLDGSLNTLNLVNKPITDYIPDYILNSMRSALNKCNGYFDLHSLTQLE